MITYLWDWFEDLLNKIMIKLGIGVSVAVGGLGVSKDETLLIILSACVAVVTIASGLVRLWADVRRDRRDKIRHDWEQDIRSSSEVDKL